MRWDGSIKPFRSKLKEEEMSVSMSRKLKAAAYDPQTVDPNAGGTIDLQTEFGIPCLLCSCKPCACPDLPNYVKLIDTKKRRS